MSELATEAKFREPLDGEIGGTARFGQFQRVCVEDGKVTGYVAVSEMGEPPEAWLHDIDYHGENRINGAILASMALHWISRRGHAHYYANVSSWSPEAFNICHKGGGEIHQIVFKMRLKK